MRFEQSHGFESHLLSAHRVQYTVRETELLQYHTEDLYVSTGNYREWYGMYLHGIEWPCIHLCALQNRTVCTNMYCKERSSIYLCTHQRKEWRVPRRIAKEDCAEVLHPLTAKTKPEAPPGIATHRPKLNTDWADCFHSLQSLIEAKLTYIYRIQIALDKCVSHYLPIQTVHTRNRDKKSFVNICMADLVGLTEWVGLSG